jgi:hypothetical protein
MATGKENPHKRSLGSFFVFHHLPLRRNIPVGFPSAKSFGAGRAVFPAIIKTRKAFPNHFSAGSPDPVTIATEAELPIRAAPTEIIAKA